LGLGVWLLLAWEGEFRWPWPRLACRATAYPLNVVMYPHFLKMHPHLYPHVPPEPVTLPRTLLH